MTKENVLPEKDKKTKDNKKEVKKETKKVSPTKKEVTKNEESNKELDELKLTLLKMQEENKKKDDKINEFMQMMAMQSMSKSNESKVITADDIVYLVTTRMLTGVDLVSSNGETIVNIPFGETVDVSQRDLREVFKRKTNKELFEDGVCTFVEEENSENEIKPESYFRIKVKHDLSDEKLMEILNLEPIKMIDAFNDLTNLKYNSNITHMLFHKICSFDIDGKLVQMPRVSYDAIEKYFGISVSKGVINLGIYKSVPRP